jgi:hypothetical protein
MLNVLACDPGAKPGFCAHTGSSQLLWTVDYKPEEFDGVRFDEAVFEAQHSASHLYRNGKRVAISRKSQATLGFTAGRLFERFTATRKYRILPDDWRRILWPGSSRLTKPVVLARLRAGYNTLVDHLPKTHQPDCLEAIGIAVAWSKLSQEQKEAYRAL